MPFKKVSRLLFFIICLSCGTKDTTKASEPLIIPEPTELEVKDGRFLLSANTEIQFEDNFKVSGEFLKSFVSQSLIPSNSQPNQIRFIEDSSMTEAEGYALEVGDDEIVIRTSSDQGAFYAVQSLRQLLPVDFEKGANQFEEVPIQKVTINDAPNFSYRGMHLDVGRHMFSVDFIKKYIDALAMLKMNTFHWHLTEDQGWRIEIKKYPKLQEIAAYRDETLVGHYSDQPHQFDGKKYGGYYTQEEIKEVVNYAKERFVTVIPEIEMPGHSQAAIAAYPELGCTSTGLRHAQPGSSVTNNQIEVAKKWGVFEDIYCTKDETFQFLEDVLDEVIALFPSEYIHIGGDEAPKTRWKTCKVCQARIKSEGLKDEHELQNYFITRIEKYLNSKGRQIIGWDEILEGGLAPNATVMSWRGTSGAVEAAKSGHNVVMTPTSHCYFDYYQSEHEDEPTAIGGYLPLEKVYGFNPIPEELTEEESTYVLGAQGNVWTEYMQTEDHVEYMVFPRILAMSEVVWSQPQNKDYQDFVSRVENFHSRLDALEINYANHLYEIEGYLTSLDDKSYYQLKTLTEDKTIRYTLDGSETDLNSKIYNSQIPVSESLAIKAAVFNGDKKLGETFSQTINFHKAVGAKISINKEPHKAYSGSGADGLINGISGSDSRYGDKEWLGFWGEDIEVTIEFDKAKEIDSISTRFYNGNGQWIYAPKEIMIEYLLEDGSKATDIRSKQFEFRENKIINMDCNFPRPIGLEIKVKSITLKIPNYGVIPEGKQGAGNKAWTFIDEIIVN
ncbi:beta-N-acetylhexosaminidase [Winogradskyella sp. A3E31]|uniref:beta-N-acetylhexosaminidase n=1 Tax=Winogradskyella sp. A3E31 TaxID=3349637 RepID=UPI00398AD12F